MNPEIIIIGAAILDVLARPTSESVFESGSYPCEDIQLSMGGDALNEAILLSKMNKQVELMTVLGDDMAGNLILDYCHNLGIIVNDVVREEIKTGVNVVLVKEDGSRHFLTNANGSLRKLTFNDIRMPFHPLAKILCFASIFVFPFIQDYELSMIFKQAKSQGMLLVADMTKCKNHETIDDLKESLTYIDYLIPNDEEILLFTQCTCVEEACMKLLEAGVKNVVVKCGKKGCYVANRDEKYWVSIPKNVHCIDSTGAGDSFVSGFIKALSENKSLKECAMFGNICGGKAVQVIGATEWL